MARIVVHEDIVDDIDAEPLMEQLATDVALDASRGAPDGTSGRLAVSVHVAEVSGRHAIIAANAKNPRSSPGNAAYAAHVERGTSDTRAQPFMRPALFRYRSGG